MKTIIPMGDNVVIRLEKEEKEKTTASGIIIPKTGPIQDKQDVGTVVAIGKGRILNDGTVVPMSVSPDDFVLFNKFAGTELMVGSEKYLMIRENDILAILKD